MSFILFLIALILILVIVPIGLIVVTFVSIFTLDSQMLRDYYFNLALSLDQLGNVAMSGLFNMILIKWVSKDKFGNPDETISSVLGKNKKDETLAHLGRWLDFLLNEIDEDHSINSIEE